MTSNILVVDDNAQNRLLAEAQLESAGYGVTLADSGVAALSLLERGSFDLVLLDVMMPGLDGFETCQRIRQLPAARGIPVLLLTASHDTAMHERALDSGADDFLRKPIERTELLLRVRSLIRITRLQAQRDLLTDMLVHDLRGPLASIAANSQYAIAVSGSDDAKEALTDVTSAAKTLHNMITNLLDIARAEDGALAPRLEEVDLVALHQQIETQSRHHLAARQQRLVLELGDTPPTALADPDLLSRVLQNLVDNAMRWAPNGSGIIVSAEQTSAHYRIRVRDDGPAVPAQERERVFHKYAQGERTGRGLGLVFCRLAAEAHGGKAWVEDGTPSGCAFVVELPIEARKS